MKSVISQKRSEKNYIQAEMYNYVKKYKILLQFYISTVSKNNLVGIFCVIKVKDNKNQKLSDRKILCIAKMSKNV